MRLTHENQEDLAEIKRILAKLHTQPHLSREETELPSWQGSFELF